MYSIYSLLASKQVSHNAARVEFTVMWLEGSSCVCMCTNLATMSAQETWALISYFSTAACHQHSYQKYIPDHNHRRTGCQNTSEHMSTNERWERGREGGQWGRKRQTKKWDKEMIQVKSERRAAAEQKHINKQMVYYVAVLRIDTNFTAL